MVLMMALELGLRTTAYGIEGFGFDLGLEVSFTGDTGLCMGKCVRGWGVSAWDCGNRVLSPHDWWVLNMASLATCLAGYYVDGAVYNMTEEQYCCNPTPVRCLLIIRPCSSDSVFSSR